MEAATLLEDQFTLVQKQLVLIFLKNKTFWWQGNCKCKHGQINLSQIIKNKCYVLKHSVFRVKQPFGNGCQSAQISSTSHRHSFENPSANLFGRLSSCLQFIDQTERLSHILSSHYNSVSLSLEYVQQKVYVIANNRSGWAFRQGILQFYVQDLAGNLPIIAHVCVGQCWFRFQSPVGCLDSGGSGLLYNWRKWGSCL